MLEIHEIPSQKMQTNKRKINRVDVMTVRLVISKYLTSVKLKREVKCQLLNVI